MESIASKTKIYLLIISLVSTLVTVAVMRSNQGSASVHKTTSASQTLDSLDKGATSPEMHKFLQRQKANEDANDEAYRDMSGK